MGSWRLVIDGPVDGATNMALDRAVLHAHESGDVPATLRLYRWARPTVTLGRFQDAIGVDLEACMREGVDVVRRPTGGRGVLHDNEVTYSIVAGVRDGVPRGVAASYRFLCQALVATYAELGVDAALTARPRGSADSSACYLHATPADLSLGAAKLSGSAQVWHRDSVLQHGSFVITRDVEREARLFRLDARDAARLAERTVTLEQAIGTAPSVTDVVEAAVRGFAEGLGIALSVAALSPTERRAAEEMAPSAVVGGVTPSI